ncbi:MAG: hypothetical protein IJ838_02235 [Paludibacteraceae bacterium]|nr:hypothetical protein [Paludibacteraceae bacterium]
MDKQVLKQVLSDNALLVEKNRGTTSFDDTDESLNYVFTGGIVPASPI